MKPLDNLLSSQKIFDSEYTGEVKSSFDHAEVVLLDLPPPAHTQPSPCAHACDSDVTADTY